MSPSRTLKAIRMLAMRSPAWRISSGVVSQPVVLLTQSGILPFGPAIMMNWHMPGELTTCMYYDAPLWCSPRPL